MSRMSFYSPYRMLNGQIGCGIQLKMEPSDMAKVYAAAPVLWACIARWKEESSYPLADCSLELAGLHIGNQEAEPVRWGVYVRLAAAMDCKPGEIKMALCELESEIARVLKEWNIPCHVVYDDTALIYHYPTWDAGRAGQFYVHSFVKKGEKSTAFGKPLVWFKELQPAAGMDFAAIEKLLKKASGCGLSLEMHGLPDEVSRKCAQYRADDTDCMTWLERIANGKGVFARLLTWGNETFGKDIENLVKRHELNLEIRRIPFTEELLHYIVYDPWACEDALAQSTSRLERARHSLTYNEMMQVFAPASEENAIAELMNSAVSLLSIGENDGIKKRLDISALILANQEQQATELAELKQTVNEGRKENLLQFQKLEERVDKLWNNVEHLIKKVAPPEQVADAVDALIPQGLRIAFTPQEMEWLGVQSEEELKEKLGMNEDVVRLMRTAFSLARVGMEEGENASIMPFAFPLGALFEYMVRMYYQPTLFENSPVKKAYIEAEQDKHQSEVREVKAAEFDKITPDQINAYKLHAKVDGRQHDEHYWRVWLNLFKVIRFSRNKAHVTVGTVEKDELKLVYNLMLKPDVEVKKDAFQYVKANVQTDRMEYRNLVNYADAQLKTLNMAPDLFRISMIQFLLCCKDAEWI